LAELLEDSLLADSLLVASLAGSIGVLLSALSIDPLEGLLGLFLTIPI